MPEAPTQNETFEAPAAFRDAARVKSREEYEKLYRRSLQDPEGFWGDIAKTFHWEKPWDEFQFHNFDRRKGKIEVRWFRGGKTNLCYNALDRHLKKNADKTAFLWEGNEPGEQRTLSFRELHEAVCRFANVLKSLGVRKGDRVAIYFPMTPELPVAMLACARIGAVHSVVFGGFSSESLADRILDSGAKVVITADGVFRGKKLVELKKIADEAVAKCSAKGHAVEHNVVYRRHPGKVEAPSSEIDRDWETLVSEASVDCPVEWLDAEDPLFMLYTSGSTGKPKGVLHSTAGYMIYTAATFRYIFDHRPDDIWWCTADCGWITGHSYIAYGPLLNGATQVVFEGIPTYPDAGRFWEIVDRYKVTLFYTAPTAIRALLSQGDGPVTRSSRKSLRLLGTVGEPINPEAWRWYHRVVGDGRCPIVDTWWQTETGGIMISPLPGAWAQKPGSATLPFFGVEPVVLDENGKELEGEASGFLAIKRPWPSLMRTVYGDHDRFEETYFERFKGYYFTGDGCRRDADGFLWITGRVDDVINVSGHRIGTAEVESALVTHPKVAEAAVVGFPHEIKGQGLYAFVTLKSGEAYEDTLKTSLQAQVRSEIGAIAVPDKIHWAPGLPKTRSGKIMRRILRKIAAGDTESLGDTTTLADPGVVDALLKQG